MRRQAQHRRGRTMVNGGCIGSRGRERKVFRAASSNPKVLWERELIMVRCKLATTSKTHKKKKRSYRPKRLADVGTTLFDQKGQQSPVATGKSEPIITKTIALQKLAISKTQNGQGSRRINAKKGADSHPKEILTPPFTLITRSSSKSQSPHLHRQAEVENKTRIEDGNWNERLHALAKSKQQIYNGSTTYLGSKTASTHLYTTINLSLTHITPALDDGTRPEIVREREPVQSTESETVPGARRGFERDITT